jgi:hemerythrin
MPKNNHIFEGHTNSLKKISDEHARLVDLLKELSSAVKNSPVDRDKITEALTHILEESLGHFAHEEEIMLEEGYAKFLDHQNHHKQTLARIQDLIARHKAGDLHVAVEASVLIRDWMYTHFKEFDKDLITLVDKKF